MAIGDAVTMVSRVSGSEVEVHRPALVLFEFVASTRDELNLLYVRVVGDGRYGGQPVRIGRQGTEVRVPHERHRTEEDLHWWR